MEQLYLGIDVHFISTPLPDGINGFLRKDKGIYYIFINCNLSDEQKKRTIKHEYNHLINSDLDDEESVRVIERRNR